ncbi:metallophosphoesterase [Paraburkholderia sabiae]|uniref:Metallophosphoesterase n=1 Tax=Paraburkholderia sabiae TaxID=273251 RepID=A0ABU9QRX3_9BURK|nr:metallophosphoesterase [Paraburkholderia sabiae]WJZ72168.1 metallophosphoesterase [Paraburkholderia sabiae]CAD6563132.1 3',5'-cyclic adenosine monophosphate phosphodiesterase CpdA [Paraburkholderia sabiae]
MVMMKVSRAGKRARSPMRIQIASDLHLENLHRSFPGYNPIAPSDADVLVLAGDIANRADAVEHFARWPVPVIYVHGNHEGYGAKYGALADDIRKRATGTAVRYIERDVLVVDDVKFLGCCLRTDYALDSTRDESMALADRMMHDYRAIRIDDSERFRPEHALAEHKKALDWLQDQLSKPFDGRTVVVTRHGVAPPSVHLRYAGDPFNAAFVSDLGQLLGHADAWIHGHVHESFDYCVGGTRVIANPLGYAKRCRSARSGKTRRSIRRR